MTSLTNIPQYLQDAGRIDGDDDTLSIDELEIFGASFDAALEEGAFTFDFGGPPPAEGERPPPPPGGHPKGPPPSAGDILVNYLADNFDLSGDETVDIDEIISLFDSENNGGDGDGEVSELELENVFEAAQDYHEESRPAKEAKGPPPVDESVDESGDDSVYVPEGSTLETAVEESGSTPEMILLEDGSIGYSLDGQLYDVDGELLSE